MKKNHGWIAKDKNGDYWFGTFCASKCGTEGHVEESTSGNNIVLKVVKVKIVEIKE